MAACSLNELVFVAGARRHARLARDAAGSRLAGRYAGGRRGEVPVCARLQRTRHGGDHAEAAPPRSASVAHWRAVQFRAPTSTETETGSCRKTSRRAPIARSRPSERLVDQFPAWTSARSRAAGGRSIRHTARHRPDPAGLERHGRLHRDRNGDSRKPLYPRTSKRAVRRPHFRRNREDTGPQVQRAEWTMDRAPGQLSGSAAWETFRMEADHGDCRSPASDRDTRRCGERVGATGPSSRPCTGCCPGRRSKCTSRRQSGRRPCEDGCSDAGSASSRHSHSVSRGHSFRSTLVSVHRKATASIRLVGRSVTMSTDYPIPISPQGTPMTIPPGNRRFSRCRTWHSIW